jgi:WD40 repeat protein
VKFSPDGSMLATAWEDGAIRIWSTSTWEPLLLLAADGHVPHAIAFAPHANQLASAGTEGGAGFTGADGLVRVWDLEDGQQLSAFDIGAKALLAIAYSPDGEVIAVGGEEHRIHAIDTWSGHTSFTLQGHTAAVNAIEFSPNGQIMASAGEDKFIRFWYVGDVLGHTCEDGIDNDGDGWLDEDDPDCAGGDKELGFGDGECNDGEDNDGDELVDSADPGCEDGLDDSEEDGLPDAGPDGGEPDAGPEPDAGTDAG